MICLLTLGTGKIPIAGFAVGVTGVFGKNSLRCSFEPDYEWLMIDASHCKVYPHAAGVVGGNQTINNSSGDPRKN